MIPIHSKADFEPMRNAGKLAARVLDMIQDFIKPDITTNELNQICNDYIIKNNAIPAPLNYHGFPKSICTSINEVVCHGIPDDRKLLDGDLLNIDVTVILNGWYGDTNRTYFVGEKWKKNDEKLNKGKQLTKVTYDAMMKSIEIVKPGIKICQIGKIIQDYVEKYGFSVVRDFCGHGIGKKFHQEPQISHFYNPFDTTILKEGMFFTIEPMINLGTWEVEVSRIDKWTVTTKDKQLSAQFEHTIGVTENGAEIFTLTR